MYACPCMCLCLWRPELNTNTEIVFLICFTYLIFWDRISNWTSRLVRLAGQKAQADWSVSIPLPLRHQAGIKVIWHHAQLVLQIQTQILVFPGLGCICSKQHFTHVNVTGTMSSCCVLYLQWMAQLIGCENLEWTNLFPIGLWPWMVMNKIKPGSFKMDPTFIIICQ